MKYCFRSTIDQFIKTPYNIWENQMVSNAKKIKGFTVSKQTKEAWFNCYHSIIQTLKNLVLRNNKFGSLEIIFEYVIPRLDPKTNKFEYVYPFRVDVVILSKTQATILEYKSAKSVSDNDKKRDVKQLIKYIDYLTKYHDECKKMKVDGALLYSKVKKIDEYIDNYLVVSTGLFGKRIDDLINHNITKYPNPDDWINGRFKI